MSSDDLITNWLQLCSNIKEKKEKLQWIYIINNFNYISTHNYIKLFQKPPKRFLCYKTSADRSILLIADRSILLIISIFPCTIKYWLFLFCMQVNISSFEKYTLRTSTLYKGLKICNISVVSHSTSQITFSRFTLWTIRSLNFKDGTLFVKCIEISIPLICWISCHYIHRQHHKVLNTTNLLHKTSILTKSPYTNSIQLFNMRISRGSMSVCPYPWSRGRPSVPSSVRLYRADPPACTHNAAGPPMLARRTLPMQT